MQNKCCEISKTKKSNFDIIASDIDVSEIQKILTDNSELWNHITVRQESPGSAHKETKTIYLRGPKSLNIQDYMGTISAMDYPASEVFGSAVKNAIGSHLKALKVQGMGYAMFVSLKPYGRVTPHVDEGVYADHYSRFHLVIRTNDKSSMIVNDEARHMKTGELWWFNHKATHSASNYGDTARIHLIFDAVTPLYEVVHENS